jgi:hypothetical protein
VIQAGSARPDRDESSALARSIPPCSTSTSRLSSRWS